MTKWLKCRGNSQWDPVQNLIYVSWYPSNSNDVQKKRKTELYYFFFFWRFCPAAEMQDEGKLRNWCPRKLVLKCYVKEYLNIPVWKLHLAYLKSYTLYTFEIAKVFWITLYVFPFSMKSWLTYMTNMFWILTIHVNGHRRGCHKIILP